MKRIIKRVITRSSLAYLFTLLSGCMVLPLKQNDPDQSLNWCPPLPNCASTEAVTFVHSIQPFKLNMEWEDVWPIIREEVNALQGTSIKHEYPGYIYAKSYSRVFHFLDYFEVLAIPDRNELSVRSSSLLGITDFFVNYLRTEQFRERLEEKGIIKEKD